jgi:ABC-type nickel/cobalt efflux system permease component RcnA
LTTFEAKPLSHQKAKPHHRDHHKNPPEGFKQPWHKQAHKDWRLWVVVGLMLVAMTIYVMTMDESLQPGGGLKASVPAAP